jgi:hypothetical protein
LLEVGGFQTIPGDWNSNPGHWGKQIGLVESNWIAPKPLDWNSNPVVLLSIQGIGDKPGKFLSWAGFYSFHWDRVYQNGK